MDKYRLKPGSKVDLSKWDPDDTGELGHDKAGAEAETEKLGSRLDALQEILYAEHKHKVLIVLQGMDTSGKDGTIRHVFEGVNPQGVRVQNFKAPSLDELAHDYLWRIHKVVPGAGEMVIFNRSHYEDVLVVRVHKLVTMDMCRQRYDQINNFERTLAENGTTILKFFLNIDMDEQRQRLQARVDDPTKQWKFNPQDLDERKLWPDYMEAYQDALSATSTDFAPWYVVPANHKWYRNLVISSTLVETLDALHLQYPPPATNLNGLIVE